MKSILFQKVPFALIPVNKDFECVHIWRKNYCFIFRGKSLLFGSNSLKISVFNKKLEKSDFTVLFGSSSSGVEIFWYELCEDVQYYFVVTPWKCILSYQLWKTCVVLFGINSPKVSVLFYMNSDKKCVLFGSISVEVSVLFDMNSFKKCVVLFCTNSVMVSELFHMNSKIIPLLFSKSWILVNLPKTEILYRD